MTATGDAPRVSFGVPVYNGEAYLETALASLRAQSFADFEVVISDNASTDRTEAICRDLAAADPRIRYQRNERNLGAAPNYNAVFEQARGTYFKWASHDDVVGEDFLARCVAVLDADPAVSLAFSRFDYIDGEGETIRPSRPDLSVTGASASERTARLVDLQIADNDVFWAIFGLMRSEQLRRTRRIESYLASDQPLLYNMVLFGELRAVPETLFFRREHPDESMIRHRSHRDRAVWFDTSREPARLQFPLWRLWREHLALLPRHGLPAGEQLRCAAHLARRFGHGWRVLGGELKIAGRELLGAA